MGDSFYMRLYTKEYLSDSKVRALPREHRSDLIDLWCHCDQDGSIPSDLVAIGRLLGISTAQARKTMEAIGSFFHADGDRLFSPRLREEHLKREEDTKKRQHGAALTNAKRWGNRSHSDSLSDTETDVESGRIAIAERVAQVSPVSSQQSVSNTPIAPKGASKRKPKVEEIGDYPPELAQALDIWRNVFAVVRGDETRERFPPGKVFLPTSGIGTRSATWEAWQKRTAQRLAGGIPITHADVLSAVSMWAQKKLGQAAKGGDAIGVKALPAMINNADFVDAIEISVKARTASQEAAHVA